MFIEIMVFNIIRDYKLLIPNNKICDIVNIYYFLLNKHNESIVYSCKKRNIIIVFNLR